MPTASIRSAAEKGRTRPAHPDSVWHRRRRRVGEPAPAAASERGGGGRVVEGGRWNLGRDEGGWRPLFAAGPQKTQLRSCSPRLEH